MNTENIGVGDVVYHKSNKSFQMVVTGVSGSGNVTAVACEPQSSVMNKLLPTLALLFLYIGCNAPTYDPLETAKAHIKTCLDSWAFGDDADTFDKAHPEITFVPVDDILRRKILTRYELGAHRATPSNVDGNEGFEFNANLWFATNGGGENLKPYIIAVRPRAGRWTVLAYEKK